MKQRHSKSKRRIAQRLRNSKRRIERRLRKRRWQEQRRRLFQDQNIHYDYSTKVKAGTFGGLGACLLLVKRLDLADTLDADLHLLKRHVPYHESDHILNLVYNILAGGTTLSALELLRNDENYLNAIGAQRIPDPTTAGDFLRRFEQKDIATLMRVINDKRLLVWKQQPPAFFEQAIVEGDGTIADTTAECKAGMDLSYKGEWGYHPLLISLANTQEPLFLHNRPASRPSHEGAASFFDQAAALCRKAGFRKVTFRGDTDFSQTEHLDRWDNDGILFVFGIDAMPNLVAKAQSLASTAWQKLDRPAKYEVKTRPRRRPAAVKEEVVRQKGYKNIRMVAEHVAEFSYRPGACKKDYRVVVLRKELVVEKKGVKVAEEVRYFFYISNDRTRSCAEVVYFANDRCNQENLIEQLKNGVKALRLPSNTLESNGAYMVIAALAWNVKAWLALLQPKAEHRDALLRMEFKKFLDVWLLLPCQILRSGRQLIFRVLQYNEWVAVLLRSVEVLRELRLR
ncbi:MAG TPA: IS1380 family transposase [Ktedonobacteraceae bacterium]|nr:IS1380 family transposase [Ktedonobacteraceae bacterium]